MQEMSMRRYSDKELQKMADKNPEAADRLMDKLGYSGKTESRTQSRYSKKSEAPKMGDDRTGEMTGAPAPKFKTGMPSGKPMMTRYAIDKIVKKVFPKK